MNLLNRGLLFLNLVLAAALVYALWFRGMPAPAVGVWEYKDIVSVLLTAVTVVVASLGILLALAAVWGYQKMAEHAAGAATKAGQDYLNSDAFFSRVSVITAEHIKNNMKAMIEAKVDVDAAGPEPAEVGVGQGDTVWKDA